MQRKELGKSGIFVQPVGMGCWAFGGGAYWGSQPQKDVEAVVHAALERGFTFFDTAEVYNNGESETALGKALAGRRAQAVVASKISPSNAAHVRDHLTASLKRLGTDYLDIYMLHWPINPLSVRHYSAEKPERLPEIEDALGQLAEVKKEGLIRSIGISNFGLRQMEEVLAAGVQIDLNEITYNIVSRAIEAEIVPFCAQHAISIVGSMALQQGLLTGKYGAPEDVPPPQAHSRHFHQSRGGAESRHNEEGAEAEIFETLTHLKKISDETGYSLSELAIAWVLAKPFIASTLVGCRNISQLELNIRACDITLDADIIRRIDEASLPVWKKLGDSPDYYENRKNSRIY
ncbi:MAG: aldo/keto reductase [Spirochaetales bacterium]|nr:aldo/keto reductase [Spirochaetales bacterium]